MQKVSKAYKESMKSSLRERAYIMISFGLLNHCLLYTSDAADEL